MSDLTQNVGVPTETLPPGQPSTLTRPGAKAIRSFRPWMVGDDTIATLLDNGWSLGICCRHCRRTIEMKPEALGRTFGGHRALKLVDLLPLLSCGVEKGCGSTDMVIFPYKEDPHRTQRKPPALETAELPFFGRPG